MKHIIGTGGLFSLNVALLWIFPAGSAITSSDPVVVTFALWGVSHLEWLMFLGGFQLHRKADQLQREVAVLNRFT